MVDDVIFNDSFQWKNSSHKTYSLGLGGSSENTNDNTDRDTVTNQQLLSAEQKEKLEDIVCKYYEAFTNTMVTVDHREQIREAACCFWDYAKNKLYGDLISQVDSLVAEERRQLEEDLCARTATLNSIGGTTRTCFAQTIISKGLAQNATQVAQVKANAILQAKQLEMATWATAFDKKYAAFIEADSADFNKYMTALQLLRGACVDETVDDTIARDIESNKINVQYNRSQGDISETADTYSGDGDNIDTAGLAALANILGIV